MVTALVGLNSFGLQSRLNELVDRFSQKYGELAVEKIDAEEYEPAQILEAVSSLPFLAERKLVVLRNLSANKSAVEVFEQIVGATGDQIELVVVEPSPDKRTVYYKNLSKLTNLESFDELDGRQLAVWLASEASKLGGKLNAADATFLVDRVGPNQQLLANELKKLVSYQPQITRETIELLSEPTPQSKIFDLLDAAFAGQKDKSLRLYDEQRVQNVEPQQILAMIAWQLRIITVLKLAGDRPNSQVAKDFGLSPFVINKSTSLVGQISIDQLKKLVHRAVEIDYDYKTRTYDLDEALKNYLISI